MQELISVGLDDTMQDILVAIAGGIVTTGFIGLLELPGSSKKSK